MAILAGSHLPKDHPPLPSIYESNPEAATYGQLRLCHVKPPKGRWMSLILHAKRIMKVGTMTPQTMIPTTTFTKRSHLRHAFKYSKIGQLSMAIQLANPLVTV